MKELVASVNRLRELLLDKRNHYTVIHVTSYVLEHLTDDDYAQMLKCGVILWRTNI